MEIAIDRDQRQGRPARPATQDHLFRHQVRHRLWRDGRSGRDRQGRADGRRHLRLRLWQCSRFGRRRREPDRLLDLRRRSEIRALRHRPQRLHHGDRLAADRPSRWPNGPTTRRAGRRPMSCSIRRSPSTPASPMLSSALGGTGRRRWPDRQRHVRRRGSADRQPDHPHQGAAQAARRDRAQLFPARRRQRHAPVARSRRQPAAALLPESWDGDYWLEAVPNLSDFYLVTYGSVFGNDHAPGRREFMDKFQAKFNERPVTSHALTGYSVIQGWQRAVERAGTFETDKVREALEAFVEEPLLAGPTTFYQGYPHQHAARPDPARSQGRQAGQYGRSRQSREDAATIGLSLLHEATGCD